MLEKFFLIMFRFLRKNLIITLINIIGLAIGFATVFIILLFVVNETSYDKHHPHSEKICRLVMNANLSGNELSAAVSGGNLGKLFHDEIPEIVKMTRFYKSARPILIRSNEKSIYQDKVIYADSSFFEVFDYESIEGDLSTALIHPRSIVLSESAVVKYFGDDNPMGKALKWSNNEDYIITGVVKDPIYNSHLKFDLLVSHSTLYESVRMRNYVDNPFAFMTFNYLVLHQDAGFEETERKVNEVFQKVYGEDIKESGSSFNFNLQPIERIHLHSDILHELEANGSATTVYTFLAIAIIILIVACINYINLSTAYSTNRAPEVGIKKTFGASKNNLFWQFISESVLTVLISFIFASILVELFLPIIGTMSNTNLKQVITTNNSIIVGFFLLSVFIGILAGIYPSIYLSAFEPIKVLKGRIMSSKSHTYWFRSTLVVIQFTFSVFLIISTISIYLQMEYLLEKDMGIDNKDLLIVPIRGSDTMQDYESIKSELLNIPGVYDITASSSYLGNFEQRRGFYLEEYKRDEMWMILHIQAEKNYPESMGLEIIKGRSFHEFSKADSNAAIINNTLWKESGWEDPIGKKISIPGDSVDYDLNVIGVCKDFHYSSLHNKIKPLLIYHDPSVYRYMNIRLDKQNVKASISLIGQKWDKMVPKYPFDYLLQDNIIHGQYDSEKQMGRLFITFSVLAILIAALGLLGLSLYSSMQKSKEIGLRKILGASVFSIELLMNREYLLKILLANVIAWPASYYFLSKWLSEFAYHMVIQWWVFPVSGIISLIIATITISVIAYRASTKNPVDVIKYE